jgi:hypothetical protein
LGDCLVGRAPRPKAITERGKRGVPSPLQHLEHRLLDQPIDDTRYPQSGPAMRGRLPQDRPAEARHGGAARATPPYLSWASRQVAPRGGQGGYSPSATPERGLPRGNERRQTRRGSHARVLPLPSYPARRRMLALQPGGQQWVACVVHTGVMRVGDVVQHCAGPGGPSLAMPVSIPVTNI